MVRIKKLLTYILRCISVDYIIEEGTSDFWHYRKGNSGIIECGGMKPAASYATTTASGKGYYVASSTSLPPKLFTQIDSVICTRGTGGNQLISISTYGINTSTISYYVFNANSNTQTFGIYFNVKGR